MDKLAAERPIPSVAVTTIIFCLLLSAVAASEKTMVSSPDLYRTFSSK